ncbi:hypothetical protein OSB04_027136 [Centaurea solstitialis]|uniref:Uncharacterized protein n=1 Tax=Centaurea solstitialis TaxID=347529 RepID=A0AA38SD89_9ASTR|nr:hypothetical protein OSB04_027136 [Centaurea solstitialis]
MTSEVNNRVEGVKKIARLLEEDNDDKGSHGVDLGLIISIVVGFVGGTGLIGLINDVERQALLQFKHGLIDRVSKLASWVGEEKECCSWEGILCDNVTGHVHQIQLRDGNCHRERFSRNKGRKLGTGLSPSILQLKQLRHLDLSCNDFEGTQIPSFLGSLRNLRYLNLSKAGFTGIIPPQLGNLSNLQVLSLQNFFDDGQLRTLNMQWLSSLHLLRHLDMSRVDLSQAIDWFQCKSPSMESLSLQSSGLSGHLPNQLGQLIHLVHLNLGFNNLVGVIPNSIGGLSSLEMLDLSHNQLNGRLPGCLGQLSKLISLDLSSNSLTGVVTEAHFAKLNGLKYLSGTGNNITLRPQLANWIPSFQLRLLYLNSWGLGPEFPSWLLSQTNLVYLDISNTKISAPMPRSFWSSFPNLTYLDMSQNHFQGTLGSIPATLNVLDLSSNKFTGNLPDFSPNFSDGFSAYLLDLSNNSFTGSLHCLLCPYDEIRIRALNLGNNHLSGVIPECWVKWQSLCFLNMENNNLSGRVPKTLGFSDSLSQLNMRGNKLSGRLPASLMNLTSLEFLQLGRNKLVGSIPTWLGRELSDLKILDLRSNNLDGNIPHELCYLTKIQIFDLAHNNLSGNIPSCFNNFSVLSGKESGLSGASNIYSNDIKQFIVGQSLVIKGREYMYNTTLGLVLLIDLSSNNLVEHIPCELMALRKLNSLNLSRNQLIGRIPEKIGDMKSLESFDLSFNKLSGKLPVSLSSLSFLSDFNVSYNNLTGRIPSSTQLQSLNESSFIGNNLCGDPLTKPCATQVRAIDQEEEEDNDDGVDLGLIISMVAGLVTDVERQALLQFKHGLVDHANKLASWVSEEKECCSWVGIVCDNYTGHVHQIQLRGKFPETKLPNLGRVLSPSMLQLKHLRHLDLSCNDFEGIQIPSFLGSLQNLRYLNLSNSRFVGIIPPQLGNLSELQVLDLKSFNDDGRELSMLNMRWLSNLHLLHHLDMSGVDLSEATDWFQCKSPSLESLFLQYSELSGNLPNQLGKLTHLVHLNLGVNNLVGAIPNSIGQLSFLRSLYLSHNQLNGSLPDSLGQLLKLEQLDLAYNQLTGSIPSSLGQLSKLNSLDFSSNLMTGVVTEAHFAKFTMLEYLNGTGNNLILRPQLANWIPPFQLKYLYLRSWDLGSQFPLWLQLQRHLLELDMSNTNISGSMPTSFLTSFPNIYHLDMSQNHIQGTLSRIPATLNMLDLSYNEFTGQLPYLSNGSGPQVLDLSNNFFTGSLHHLLCPDDEKWAEILDLGNNHLSGVIPECWLKWQLLRFLNLENNNMSGEIPKALSFSFYLFSLNMRGNKLSGRLPVSLMSLKNLELLQLGKNKLTGSIPTWLGTELPLLRSLNLRSNNFEGNIPQELCCLKNIHILDLAHNNLSGDIPRCFNNFSVLSGKEIGPYVYNVYVNLTKEYIMSESLVIKGREDIYSTILGLVSMIDLSSNNLVGHIPSELTGLWKLHSLNLLRNQLTGKIPEKIGNMKSLESFDLSLNKLSGELPMSLSSLSFLSSFNVSYNRFTGRIPSGTQLQSLNESSFFGNNLCGDPLTKHCVVEARDKDHKEEEQDGSHGPDWGLIISMALGLVTGFWITVAPLIFIRSWRIAYFRFLTGLAYMAYDLIHKYCCKMFLK